MPVDGKIVIAPARLNPIRAFNPLAWRMHVEAGRTRSRRAARPTRERAALPVRPEWGREFAASLPNHSRN